MVEFCQINTLPDLACLGINQTGKPGERYELDNGVVWREEMDRVAAFDWNAWTGHWHTFAIAASKAAIKLGRVKESVASEMRYRYWNINRTKYPSYTPEQAGAVLELIMEGHSVEEAFDDVLGKSQHAI